MRPLIVIGADDAMRTALEPYAEVGHIAHHDTAESAHFALADAGTDTDGEDGGWDVHVAYGPGALGYLASGHRNARLPHAGRTLIVTWQVDPDPGKPRRVVESQPSGTDPDTRPWQVAAAIGADFVVDVATAEGLEFLTRLLLWKDGAHT